jgi:Family of unknown function (DUF6328)
VDAEDHACVRCWRDESCGGEDGGDPHGAERLAVYGPAVAGTDDDRGAQPGESPKQRHDRELIELLNELRVALPGVQVLFAFLLAVPFAQGWRSVTPFQKDVFFVAFVATAVSSILLIAPSAFHRIGWRVEDKGRIVAAGNGLALAGLGALAVAIEAVVLLVADYIFELTTAVVTVAVLGVVVAIFWLLLPLRGRVRY